MGREVSPRRLAERRPHFFCAPSSTRSGSLYRTRPSLNAFGNIAICPEEGCTFAGRLQHSRGCSLSPDIDAASTNCSQRRLHRRRGTRCQNKPPRDRGVFRLAMSSSPQSASSEPRTVSPLSSFTDVAALVGILHGRLGVASPKGRAWASVHLDLQRA